MLYILAGLPGTGKSTLARHLARAKGAVYLRIDTTEHALRESGVTVDGPQGYIVAYRLAEDNLRLGLPVVADSVNPLALTRAAWRGVARRAGVPFVEIEVVCSDRAEHRRRVETRLAGIAGFPLPSWQDVVQREYEPWDTTPLVVDTAGQTEAESTAALLRLITGD